MTIPDDASTIGDASRIVAAQQARHAAIAAGRPDPAADALELLRVGIKVRARYDNHMAAAIYGAARWAAIASGVELAEIALIEEVLP